MNRPFPSTKVEMYWNSESALTPPFSPGRGRNIGRDWNANDSSVSRWLPKTSLSRGKGTEGEGGKHFKATVGFHKPQP